MKAQPDDEDAGWGCLLLLVIFLGPVVIALWRWALS